MAEVTGRRRRLRAAPSVAGWLAGWWLLARPRVPSAGPLRPTGAATGTGTGRRVSVLVPARDEEASLPHLLASLAAQHRPADEVIVVDDASTDRTGAIARRSGATVIDSSGPPDGWSGKCWALHQGQAAATGELLVFLDADVTLAPDGLARLVAEHDRMGGSGIVSAEPWHRTGAPVEQLSAVANVVALLGTGAFAAVGGAPRPMAFGPCLVVDRPTYDAAGGHAHPDVRPRICEDLYLARAVHRVGRPVAVFAGGDAVAMRMYPQGARQAFDGWTKVLATGAAGGSPLVAAAVALWVTGALLGARSGASAVTGGGDGGGRRRSGLAYAAWAVQIGVLQQQAGSFGPLTAVAYPVPLGFFVAASLRSAATIGLGRPLAWRGRSLTGRSGS